MNTLRNSSDHFPRGSMNQREVDIDVRSVSSKRSDFFYEGFNTTRNQEKQHPRLNYLERLENHQSSPRNVPNATTSPHKVTFLAHSTKTSNADYGNFQTTQDINSLLMTLKQSRA